jgi:hypothetical protein
VKPSDAAVLEAELAKTSVPFRQIGTVTDNPDLQIATGASAYNWPVAELSGVFEQAIPSLMEG